MIFLKVNDVWQSKIDSIKSWKSDLTISQKFYDHFVGEYRRKDTKLVVIISDAMDMKLATNYYQ